MTPSNKALFASEQDFRNEWINKAIHVFNCSVEDATKYYDMIKPYDSRLKAKLSIDEAAEQNHKRN